MKYSLISIITILILNSCIGDEKVAQLKLVQGYKPIYAPYETIKKIESLSDQKLKKPGKIYIKDNFLFINDIGRGIFVYDNSDKKNPKMLSFLSIPANNDMSIKGNFLFADNGEDLITVDITNPKSPIVGNRLEKMFPYPSYPAERGSFECVDQTKGYVIGWQLTELENPKCFR